mgnify:CR=1 FL=1|tara:strand:+ start:320 stop:424 length:105 start_codon:yes stop_codon:yes gene_type:complete
MYNVKKTNGKEKRNKIVPNVIAFQKILNQRQQIP